MVTVEIKLNEKKWLCIGDTAIRSGVFYKGEYFGADAEHLLSDVTTPDTFRETINDLNGQFAVVVDTIDSVYAAVDHIASIPLFYAIGERAVYIGDDPVWMNENLPDNSCDQDAATEFLLAGYVTGNDTLYPRIKRLQPGQMLSIDRAASGEPSVRQYYALTRQEIVSESKQTLLDRFDAILENAFERLVERADGDPIIVGLSGGYDSRLIALMLDRVGYENVYAFTLPSIVTEEDLETAREIAPEFELEWAPLDVTKRDYRELPQSEEYRRLKRAIEDYTTSPPFAVDDRAQKAEAVD